VARCPDWALLHLTLSAAPVACRNTQEVLHAPGSHNAGLSLASDDVRTLPWGASRCRARAVQEQVRLFEARERPPARAHKAGAPKQDAVPEFLSGRQLRDYQVRARLPQKRKRLQSCPSPAGIHAAATCTWGLVHLLGTPARQSCERMLCLQ